MTADAGLAECGGGSGGGRALAPDAGLASCCDGGGGGGHALTPGTGLADCLAASNATMVISRAVTAALDS